MNDASGWYLPYIYIDDYIDVHGNKSVDKTTEDVIKGVIDETACSRLFWFISDCNTKGKYSEASFIFIEGDNKSYDNFHGSYINSNSNVYPHVTIIVNYFFVFSKKNWPN